MSLTITVTSCQRSINLSFPFSTTCSSVDYRGANQKPTMNSLAVNTQLTLQSTQRGLVITLIACQMATRNTSQTWPQNLPPGLSSTTSRESVPPWAADDPNDMKALSCRKKPLQLERLEIELRPTI